MNIKEFIASKTFKGIVIGAGVIILCAIIFQAGVMIGYRKAAFSYKFGDNYHRIFVGRPQSEMQFPPNDLLPGHGVNGKIVKIDLPGIVIESPDNTERSVIVSDKTEIRRFKESLKPEDLKTDDAVVIIGSPNDNGEIEARLIRLMPTDFQEKAPAENR